MATMKNMKSAKATAAAAATAASSSSPSSSYFSYRGAGLELDDQDDDEEEEELTTACSSSSSSSTSPQGAAVDVSHLLNKNSSQPIAQNVMNHIYQDEGGAVNDHNQSCMNKTLVQSIPEINLLENGNGNYHDHGAAAADDDDDDDRNCNENNKGRNTEHDLHLGDDLVDERGSNSSRRRPQSNPQQYPHPPGQQQPRARSLGGDGDKREATDVNDKGGNGDEDYEVHDEDDDDFLKHLFDQTIDAPCQRLTVAPCMADLMERQLDLFTHCRQPLEFWSLFRDGDNSDDHDASAHSRHHHHRIHSTVPMNTGDGGGGGGAAAYYVLPKFCEYCGAQDARDCNPQFCQRPRLYFAKNRPPFAKETKRRNDENGVAIESLRWDPVTDEALLWDPSAAKSSLLPSASTSTAAQRHVHI